MSQWPMVKLGDVCTFSSGGTPNRKKPEFYSGTIPWISSADINENGDISTRRYITDEAIQRSSAIVVPPGTLLLVTRTGVGKVSVSQYALSFSQDITAIEINNQSIDKDYLVQTIRHFAAPRLLSKARGATILGVKRNDVSNLEIPLPPLEEQRRIAQVLTQTSLNISNTKQRIDLLNTICRTPIFANPSRPSTELKEYIRTISTGKSVKDTSDPNSGNKILKISAVTSGFFKGNETKYLPVEYSPKESHAVDYGNLLVSRANTSEMIGASALVDQDESNVFLPDKLWKIIPAKDVSKEAIWHLLQLPTIRKRMSQVATGSSGSMKNISQRSFLKVEVPDLTLSEISSITEVVKRILSTRKLLLKKLTLLEELHQSLATRAFAGQL